MSEFDDATGRLFSKANDIVKGNPPDQQPSEGFTSIIGRLFGINPAVTPAPQDNPLNYVRAQTHLAKFSVARDNLFRVELRIPPSLLEYQHASSTTFLSLYADATNLPGLTLMLTETDRYGTGMIQRSATGIQHGVIQTTFIGDAQGFIHQFFYRWFDNIVRFSYGPNEGTWSSITSNSTKFRGYEVAYRNTYTTTMDIVVYDEASNEIKRITLDNVFPISIGEIQLNWASENSLIRIPITFSYDKFRYQFLDENTLNDQRDAASAGGMVMNPLQKIVRAGTAVQTVMAMKKPQSIGDVINVVNNAKIVIEGLGGNK